MDQEPLTTTTCFLCGFSLVEELEDVEETETVQVLRARATETVQVLRARAVYRKSPYDDIDRNTPTADVLLSDLLPYAVGFLSLEHERQDFMVIACVTTNERPERHDLPHSFRPFHEGPIRPGYPIHEPCYKILCQVRECSDMTADLQAIFDICTSFPLSIEGVFWGHNHESLQPLEPAEGKEGFLNLYNGETFSVGSHSNDDKPHKNLDLMEGSREKPREELSTFSRISRTTPSLLRMLPREIISEILLYLPSVTVRNLQLADPIFDEAQNFQRFWASRFALDREFGYVNKTMPDDMKDRWDRWDRWYKQCKKCHSASKRGKIWRLAHQMCHLIHQRHENAKLLRGSASDITKDEAFWQSDYHDDRFSLCKVPNITGLVDQIIEVTDDIWHVVFSFATIANRRYISGLRLHGANNWQRTLGYFSSKGYQTSPCCSQRRARELITGFDIALDNLGIRGLRILTASKKPFEWVGEQTGLPKRRLIVTSDDGNTVPRYVKQIRCSFDGFKLAGIAISSTSDSWPSVSQDDQDFALEGPSADRHVVPEKEIWYPDLPPLGLKYVKLNKDDRPPEQPYHHCIFGGSRGERLQHLNKIIITADEHVRSVAFQFDNDGEKMDQVEFTRPRYGLKPEKPLATVSLDIDGARGERITRVESFRDPSTEILTSLQIFTNKERTICSQTTDRADHRLSNDGVDVYDITQSPCETGRNIVGFFGTMMAHTSQGGISGLGVVCI